jgi:hypothetical protein
VRFRRRPAAPTRAVLAVASVLCAVASAAATGPAPASAAAAQGPTAAAGPPAGTVGRAGRHLVDLDGRALFLHGVTVAPGERPAAEAMERWVADGFTAVRLGVRMAADGSFPGEGAVASAPGGPDPGLDELAVTARAFTDRGFRVVLHIVADPAGAAASPAALAAAVTRMSARFAGVGGLVGFEVDPPATTGIGDLFTAVRRVDPYHLLWWTDAAPLRPDARVARNDAASYLVDWGATTLVAVAALAQAAQAAQLGWFYELPATAPALPALTRPHPAAVAGTPLAFAADDAGVFTLDYGTERLGGGRFADGTATAVILPAAAYPDGYRVEVAGARVTSAPGSGVLCLVAEPGAGQVRLRVRRAPVGTAIPVARAGSVASCPARPGAARGDAPPSSRAGGAPADANADGDSPALLVLFPLIGAVGTALLLGGALGLVRLRRGDDPVPDP